MDDDLYDFGGDNSDSIGGGALSGYDRYGSQNAGASNYSSHSSYSTRGSSSYSSYSSKTDGGKDFASSTGRSRMTQGIDAADAPGTVSSKRPRSDVGSDPQETAEDTANNARGGENVTAEETSGKVLHPLGFVDQWLEPVSVSSEWKYGMRSTTSSCQTKELRMAVADTQTSELRDAGVQTNVRGAREGRRENPEVFSGFDGWSPVGELSSFLVTAGATIEKQLKLKTHAFDEYDAALVGDDEMMSCLHVLTAESMRNVKTVDQVLEEEARQADMQHAGGKRGESTGKSFRSGSSDSYMGGYDDFSLPGMDLQVTGMSWNSTGSVLAVAFGRHDESGWCNITRAGCGLFHVFSRDFDPSKPQTVLDTSSYLMSVACHPEIPGIVAGGTFNGEVVIWDTAREEGGEQQIACSAIDDYFHREPVVSVSWVYDSGQQTWNLASISGEGKVLFWTLKNNLEYPMFGHLLAVKAKGKNSRVVAGGTAMSFQTGGKHSSSFVVGAESGMLFRCNMKQIRARVAPPADAASMWSPEAWALLSRVRSAERDGELLLFLAFLFSLLVSQLIFFPAKFTMNLRSHVFVSFVIIHRQSFVR